MLARSPYYIEGKSVDTLPDGVYGDIDDVLWSLEPEHWDEACLAAEKRDEALLAFIAGSNWMHSLTSAAEQFNNDEEEDW